MSQFLLPLKKSSKISKDKDHFFLLHHFQAFSKYLLNQSKIGLMNEWLNELPHISLLTLRNSGELFTPLEKWHISNLSPNISSNKSLRTFLFHHSTCHLRAWWISWQSEVMKFLKRLTKWPNWYAHWKSLLYRKKWGMHGYPRNRLMDVHI